MERGRCKVSTALTHEAAASPDANASSMSASCISIWPLFLGGALPFTPFRMVPGRISKPVNDGEVTDCRYVSVRDTKCGRRFANTYIGPQAEKRHQVTLQPNENNTHNQNHITS